MAGAPAVYHPVVAISAYPFDFNSDGTPEFIVGWSNQGIQLYVAQPEAQVITTHRSEEVLGTIVHPYPLPLPGGVLIGADPPGTNVRWGNYLPEFTADILGLGPAIGRYGMSFYMGGGEGYWYRPWNQLLPADWDYIGVRFQLEDGLHYGYLHFGYEPNTGGLNPIHYAVLRGWAWETEPGKSILIVPETSSAGLAAGAAVLATLRRRRRG